MTTFVRSLFAKRNPRNVPLDLHDLGRHDSDRIYARGRETGSKYREIYVEALRGIGETLARMKSKDLFRGTLSTEGWVSFGTLFASVLRDSAAADLTREMWIGRIFLPGETVNRWHSHGIQKKHNATEYQERFETRTALFERWLIARCAFEARPEIIAARAIRPIGNPSNLAAEVSNAQHWIDSMRSAHFGEQEDEWVSDPFDQLWKSIVAILRDRGFSDIAHQYETLPVASVPKLKTEVSRAEKLALKGEPKISRKQSKAEEARIAALERAEPKENPFIRSILR